MTTFARQGIGIKTNRMKNVITQKSLICQNENCFNNLRPWNSASNFNKPALSVLLAYQKGIIQPHHNILEFGAGNLRNASYILNSCDVSYSVIENKEVTIRFNQQYRDFINKGGHIINFELLYPSFDIIICTFVLETICPSKGGGPHC